MKLYYCDQFTQWDSDSCPDFLGIFSTLELAQEYINKKHQKGFYIEYEDLPELKFTKDNKHNIWSAKSKHETYTYVISICELDDMHD